MFLTASIIAFLSQNHNSVRQHKAPVLEDTVHVMAPASVKPSARSARMFERFGRYTAGQVNVDSSGQNILGDAANEPSIVVDPFNPSNMAIGWRQFDSVTSNFRQSGYGYTLDAGKTWTFPGKLENNIFRSDPVLAADPGGVFHYNSLHDTFFTDTWHSLLQGTNWVNDGFADGGDKQWWIIDRSNSSGRGNMYQIWSTAGNNFGGRQFNRSIDGGKTWSQPTNLPNFPIWGVPYVGKSGDLYIGGMADDFSSFWFLRSSDAKSGTDTPTWDIQTPVSLGGTMNFAANVNPGGLAGQTWLVSDNGSSSHSGNIYMLCSVFRDNNNPCDVMFTRSTDGGRSWSAPQRVNDDPADTGHYHWFGCLSVAPNGRLDVVWNDTRNDPTTATSALFYSSSLDGGLTWTKNTQVTQQFNQSLGYPQQNKMGDYLTVISDNKKANVAFAATFNGEEDVYYMPLEVVTPIRAKSVSMFEGSSFSGFVNLIWAEDRKNYSVTATLYPRMGTCAAAQANFVLPLNLQSAGSLSIAYAMNGPKTAAGQIFIYNWTTKQWDFQASTPLRTSDVVGTVDVNPAANYIGPGGQVQVLARSVLPTRFSTAPYVFNVDQVQLQAG